MEANIGPGAHVVADTRPVVASLGDQAEGFGSIRSKHAGESTELRDDISAWPPARGPSTSRNHHPRKVRHAPAPALNPNNCIVLKSLDSTVTAEDVEVTIRDALSDHVSFTNLSLVDDKHTGGLRKMAFLNFQTVEDAKDAMQLLASIKIKNRTVLAEYRRPKTREKDRKESTEKHLKKVSTVNVGRSGQFQGTGGEHDEPYIPCDKRTSFFSNLENGKKSEDRSRSVERLDREKEIEQDFRSQLMAYRDAELLDGEQVQDVCFDQDLSSRERRIVHVLCDELNLGHVSRSLNDGSRVLFVTKDPSRKEQWEIETAEARAVAAEKAAEKASVVEEKRRRQREALEKQRSEEIKSSLDLDVVADVSGPTNSNLPPVSSPRLAGYAPREHLEGIKWFRPRAAIQVNDGVENNEEIGTSSTRGIEKPSYKLYVPPRQPAGPDGTIGFSRRNQSALRSSNIAPSEEMISIAEDSSKADDLMKSGSQGLRNGSEKVDIGGSTSICTDPTLDVPVGSATKPHVQRKSRIVLNPNVPEFKFPML